MQLRLPNLFDSSFSFARQAAQLLMNETAEIWVATNSADGLGGETKTYANSGKKVKCTLIDIASSSRSQGEAVVGNRKVLDSDYMVSMPWDTDLGQTDRLKINTVMLEIRNITNNSDQLTLDVACMRVHGR